MQEYDLIVIGAGSAGLVAASFAGQFGSKVALIERENLGGDCTWVGCVPSKALLKVSKMAHAARAGEKFGIKAPDVTVDMEQVRDYVQGVIQNVYQHETPEEIEKKGVEVVLGSAQFTDAHTVEVQLNSGETRKMSGKKFIIATGARPAQLPIPGLADVPYHTYRTLFENTTLPERMITIGAGPIGMEMSQAYARLGAQVTVFADKIMQNDDPEVGETLRSIFEDEGIEFRLGFVDSVRQEGDEIVVVCGDQEVRADMLLMAAGRVPNVDSMNLEGAGVAYDKRGVTVDDSLRTTVEHIYAAGDIAGGPQFTHYAGFQGYIAARNALLPGSSSGVARVLPWTTFTEPEAAHVGLTEAQARDQFQDVRVKRFGLDHGDRSQAEDDTRGFIKVVYRANGKLLGATVVANRAGEMINEYAISLQNGWGVGDLSNTIHVYPTYGQIVSNLSSKMKVEQLMDGVSGQVFKVAKRVLF